MKTFIPKDLPGSTPLNPNEMKGLIPDYITTQSELNQLEQQNILEAINWVSKKRSIDPLNISFAFTLHKKMFDQVWKWSGKQRSSDKNIGVPWAQIPAHLKQHFENTKYWISHQTYPWDEILARFHHKLVWIHAFPNGNGRHARLMTDILAEKNEMQELTWGGSQNFDSLQTESEIRERYLKALRKSDQGDYSDLIAFIRS